MSIWLAGLRQDFETAVGDQPQLRVALADALDQPCQPLFLLLSRGGRRGGKLVGIERVEKQAAITALPQRCDHFVDKKRGQSG